MNKKYVFTLLVCLIALGLLLKKKPMSQVNPTAQHETGHLEHTDEENSVPDLKIETKEAAPVTELPISDEKLSFTQQIEKFKPTSMEQARKDIAQNPHAPPASGMASALEIRELFNSIQTSTEANLFLQKMSDCFQESSDTPVSVKVTCLEYSRRLLDKFPEMKNNVEQMAASASADAIDVEKMMHEQVE